MRRRREHRFSAGPKTRQRESQRTRGRRQNYWCVRTLSMSLQLMPGDSSRVCDVFVCYALGVGRKLPCSPDPEVHYRRLPTLEPMT